MKKILFYFWFFLVFDFVNNAIDFSSCTSITPITVKKNNTNSWSFSTFYTNSYETKDKYFLLSESEVFGTERFYE